MISKVKAIEITSNNFPNGPEFLANELGISVLRSPMQGVNGWCIKGPQTIIRLNSSQSAYRQRFTLAHELAHLVLRTKPDIAIDPFQSNQTEEREADELASQFLIPINKLKTMVGNTLPIDITTIKRVAKQAKVSPVMAACRMVNSVESLGLQNAAALFFKNDKCEWNYSTNLKFNIGEETKLFKLASENTPNVARIDNEDGNVIVASILDAQQYQLLFVQLLSQKVACVKTREEELRELAVKLFIDDESFRQSVAAMLGITKNKCKGKRLDDAVQFFYENNVGTRYKDDQENVLSSQIGRKYVRLYLQKWFV